MMPDANVDLDDLAVMGVKQGAPGVTECTDSSVVRGVDCQKSRSVLLEIAETAEPL